MKKLICLVAAMGLLFLSCGTVHKEVSSLKTSRDSSASSARDSTAITKRDSAARVVDRSVTTTIEYIVNDIDIPGVQLQAQSTFADLLKWPTVVVSADGADTLKLSVDKKDSTIKASLYQRAQKLHQTINRTIQNYANVDTKISVAEQSITAVKTKSKADIRVTTDTESKKVDRDNGGLLKNIGLAAVLFMVIIAGYFIYAKFIAKKF